MKEWVKLILICMIGFGVGTGISKLYLKVTRNQEKEKSLCSICTKYIAENMCIEEE